MRVLTLVTAYIQSDAIYVAQGLLAAYMALEVDLELFEAAEELEADLWADNSISEYLDLSEDQPR